jgi:hypothetical protein
MAGRCSGYFHIPIFPNGGGSGTGTEYETLE